MISWWFWSPTQKSWIDSKKTEIGPPDPKIRNQFQKHPLKSETFRAGTAPSPIQKDKPFCNQTRQFIALQYFSNTLCNDLQCINSKLFNLMPCTTSNSTFLKLDANKRNRFFGSKTKIIKNHESSRIWQCTSYAPNLMISFFIVPKVFLKLPLSSDFGLEARVLQIGRFYRPK